MASTTVIKPAVGDKVHRMSDEPLYDQAKKEQLPNTKGNIVNFKVEYPKDAKKGVIKGAPYFGLAPDSIHKLHVIHAEALEEKGIGKIQK